MEEKDRKLKLKIQSLEKVAETDIDQQRSTLQRIGTVVDSRISDAFENLGRFVTRWAYLVIIASIVLSIVLSVAFFKLFKQERDLEDLYTPPHAPSFGERAFVHEKFDDHMREVRVLITRSLDLYKHVDCTKRNLFVNDTDAKNVLLDYMTLYENIESQWITYNGEVFKLKDVCRKPVGHEDMCKTKSILDIWGYDREKLEEDENVIKTMLQAVQTGQIKNQFGVPIAAGFVAGINKNGEGCNNNVEVLQMSFALQNDRVVIDGASIDPESYHWTMKLIDTVTKDWKNENNLIGYVSCIDAVAEESQKSLDKDVVKMGLGYALVILFSHWVLFKDSPIFCKTHLASVSALSVGMAILSAFGAAQICGVRFNLVVQALPFLLLGLGMDDTFVILGAYHATSVHQPVEDRMAKAMARAGSSILVTSVTDLLAFLVGMYTDLPALQAFAVHAFFGIFFDFLYQVTFFAAFLSLDAHRENRAINGAPFLGVQCGCTATQFDVVPMTEAPKCQCTKRDPSDCEKGSLPNVISGKNWRRRIFCCSKMDYDPQSPSLSTKIIGEWLPKVTLHPVGSGIILLIEVLVLTFAIHGCTKVSMDFRYREWFVPKESTLQHAFEIERTYFAGNQQPFSVFTKKPTDGRDFFYHQDDYQALIGAVRTEEYVARLPPVTSWYEDFSRWLVSEESPFKNDVDKVTGRAPNATVFTAWVRYYLEDPAGAFYNGDVVFGADGIEATRFNGYTLGLRSGTFAVKTVDNIRDAVKSVQAGLDAFAYSINFLFFDGLKIISRETVRNVLMAGAAVFVITTIVLADLLAAVIVTLMIALTDIMIFGFLPYAGLTFNTVTAINLVVAIGIAVDYSAHIAHSFLVLDGSHKQRAAGALHHIGGEVAAGAFTTWLAIAVMGAAQHYIFKVFFRMFFAIIVTGAWHGIVILPIVLRFLGPKSHVPNNSDS